MSVCVRENGLIVRRSKCKSCELEITIQASYVQHMFIIIKSKEVKSKRARIKIMMRGYEWMSHNARTCKENGHYVQVPFNKERCWIILCYHESREMLT